jgi:hypothetical protein
MRAAARRDRTFLRVIYCPYCGKWGGLETDRITDYFAATNPSFVMFFTIVLP